MKCDTLIATIFSFQTVLLLVISKGGDATSYYNSLWSIVPHRHRKVLAGDEKDVKVLLEWSINFESETVIFDLTARTTGYVGFGLKRPSSSLSKHNEDNMALSDIVIGGIYPNGTSYFTDYHSKDSFTPVPDESQDWALHAAFENATHTFLRFSRQFDTCDSQDDIRIQKEAEPLQAIWALGSNDLIKHHGLVRHGSIDSITLLKQPETESTPPPDLKAYSSWRVKTSVEMKREYDYRCTFHRGPTFNTPVHAVAFTPILSDSRVINHVHHFTLYQCKVPRIVNYDYSNANNDYRLRKAFEPLVAEKQGFECYSAYSRLPIHLCMQTLYVWGPGENGMYFPDQAGYLVSGESTQTYFMIEVHYENPEGIFNNVTFEVGVEMFYTKYLRKYDAGFMVVAHAVSDSLFVPPHSREFKIEGRCSGECTNRSVPTGGVTVIGVMLHAHLYARKLKLHHFRNEMELPWLAVDDKFSFKSHKMQPIFEQRKIMPGDTLVVECEYNTEFRDTVTTGGFSSSSEMCTAFLWYFPNLSWDDCSSGYPPNQLYNFFGYRNPAVNEGNSQNALNFTTFINTQVEWTDKLRNDLQQILTGSYHHASCLIPQQRRNSYAPVKPVKPVILDSEMIYQPRKTTNNNTKHDMFRCRDKKSLKHH